MGTDSIYLVGEIGQNHNGSVDIAKLIVELAVRPVPLDAENSEYATLDAVKMTKRDLGHELARSQMAAPYGSRHAFGRTYGEHRAALEIDDDGHFEVYRYCKEKGLDFVETICGVGAMSVLRKFIPDRLKVASRDITNHPLLEALAETGIPMILSTGMAGVAELDSALSIITRRHENISILHCVSEYPTAFEHCNLRRISRLRERYPRYVIGFSDHTDGLTAPLLAVSLGAGIIEKHITIDREMKGTDQFGSLGPDGIRRLVRDIRRGEKMLGDGNLEMPEGAASSKAKLARSIASARTIRKGERIELADVQLLSPGDGFSWLEKDRILGKTAAMDLAADEIIYSHMIRAD